MLIIIVFNGDGSIILNQQLFWACKCYTMLRQKITNYMSTPWLVSSKVAFIWS